MGCRILKNWKGKWLLSCKGLITGNLGRGSSLDELSLSPFEIINGHLSILVLKWFPKNLVGIQNLLKVSNRISQERAGEEIGGVKRNIPLWQLWGAVQCTPSALTEPRCVPSRVEGISWAIHDTSLQHVKHMPVRNTRELTLEFCFVHLAKNRRPKILQDHSALCDVL